MPTDQLKRTFKRYGEHNLSDWAAALTYYAILSIFPALVALVSVVGLLGDATAQSLIANIETLTPGPAKDMVVQAIDSLRKSQGTAGLLLVIGIGGAIWSASGYVGAFMRASNAVYEVGEGRPIYKTLPVRVGVTLILLVLLTITAAAVVLTGSVARQVGSVVGLGDTAVSVWDYAKWPVLLVIVGFIFSLLYWAAPNVTPLKYRLMSAGGALAVVIWVVASAAFAFYLAHFSSYNKTYGALGGAIAFLTWLWISNIAVLLGAELNAVRADGNYVERDTKKLSDSDSKSLAPISSRSSP